MVRRGDWKGHLQLYLDFLLYHRSTLGSFLLPCWCMAGLSRVAAYLSFMDGVCVSLYRSYSSHPLLKLISNSIPSLSHQSHISFSPLAPVKNFRSYPCFFMPVCNNIFSLPSIPAANTIINYNFFSKHYQNLLLMKYTSFPSTPATPIRYSPFICTPNASIPCPIKPFFFP